MVGGGRGQREMFKRTFSPAKWICESSLNYHESTLHGLPIVISRAHAMSISLVLLWSITYAGNSAATNFVFNSRLSVSYQSMLLLVQFRVKVQRHWIGLISFQFLVIDGYTVQISKGRSRHNFQHISYEALPHTRY